MQGLVFCTNLDGVLRTAVKSHRTPEEILDYLPVKEKLTKIQEALAKEAALRTPAPGTTPADQRTAAMDTETGDGTGHPLASSSASQPTADEKLNLRVKAARFVKSGIKLLVEPPSELAMATMLKTSETVASWRGNSGTDYIGIIFDPAVANEAITSPHIRAAPFQKNQYSKLVNGTLKARALAPEEECAEDGNVKGNELASGDLFVTLDAGRHGSVI